MRDANLATIRRWMAMDRDLLSPAGLKLSAFAELWSKDVKTIRRDLALLRRLGFSVVLETRRPGRDYVWRYTDGQRPMFTATEAWLEAAMRRQEEIKRRHGPS